MRYREMGLKRTWRESEGPRDPLLLRVRVKSLKSFVFTDSRNPRVWDKNVFIKDRMNG